MGRARDGMDEETNEQTLHYKVRSMETARTKVLERTKQMVRTRELGELGNMVATLVPVQEEGWSSTGLGEDNNKAMQARLETEPGWA